MRQDKSYQLHSSPLYNLRRKAKAAELLQTTVAFLEKLVPEGNYSYFYEPKPDGNQRTISAPNQNLKKVQKRLLDLLRRIDRPKWLISGTRGKSYIDNAMYHKDNPYVLTIDIRKFYDSCAHKYVHRLFRDTFRMSPDVAWIFSKLTTLNLSLPTGAPTSQLVAFFSYSSAFYALNKAAEDNGCLFSLYVDDMTFSSKKPINISSLLREINRILNSADHRIKYSKVKYFKEGNCKLITGTAIDGFGVLRVPNKLRAMIRDDLNILKSDLSYNHDITKTANRLKGRLQAARNIEPGIFPQIYECVKKLS